MPTSDNNFVTAIIVSHNGALWLPEVVASLAKQRRAIDQIIAIDTGSEDSSVKLAEITKPFNLRDFEKISIKLQNLKNSQREINLNFLLLNLYCFYFCFYF